MKKILGLVLSLTIIAGICAAVLAYVNGLTAGPIAEMQVKKAQEAAKAVMPAGVATLEKAAQGDVEYYVGKSASGEILGYAVTGSDPGGYGGDVVLMVG